MVIKIWHNPKDKRYFWLDDNECYYYTNDYDYSQAEIEVMSGYNLGVTIVSKQIATEYLANYNYLIVYDLTTPKPISKCTCGADKAKTTHSHWCDKVV